MDNKVHSELYDLHIHCGPEAIPRKYDFLELGSKLKQGGMAGAVIKSHFHSTAPWAYMSMKYGHEDIFGSVVLNHYVGGINPHAILGSLGVQYRGRPCIKVVWMPTLHASGHLKMQMAQGQGYDIPTEWTDGAISPGRQELSSIEPITIFDRKNEENLLEVLQLIARYDLVLATGHLTREEVMYLVPKASAMGIKKVIVTHPIYPSTGLDVDDLLELIAYDGVYIEQSYGLVLIDGIPIEEIAEQIKLIGPSHTILTSDLGQCQTIEPAQGMQEYIKLLTGHGVDSEDIVKMLKTNPKYLLGI